MKLQIPLWNLTSTACTLSSGGKKNHSISLMPYSVKLRGSYDSSSLCRFTVVNHLMQSGLLHRSGQTVNTSKNTGAFLLPVKTGLLAFIVHSGKLLQAVLLTVTHQPWEGFRTQPAAWPVYAFKQFPAKRKYEVAVYPSNNLKHN